MAGASLARREAEDSRPAKAVEALAQLLDDLAAVLVGVPVDVYVARPLPDVSGSVGAQVRHTLDHIAAFLTAGPAIPLSYDRRERGTAVESDTAAALRTIFRLKTALTACTPGRLHDPIEVLAQVTPGGDSVLAWSSRARELAFVQSHTIHHLAIISMLLTIQGYGTPPGFGHAPSTPRP